MNTTRAATAATERAFVLGEGPVWDDRAQRLLWVDIVDGAVLVGSVEGDRIAVVDELRFATTVGAVALTDGDDLLVAGRDRLIRVGADGSRREGPPLFDDTGRRLNDGKPDPAGRYLIGTLSLSAPSHSEQLLRVDGSGVAVIDDDLTLSNGLAWNADGSRLYSVDTLGGVVRVRDYDPASGATGAWSVFATPEAGYPDGICIDADDHVWVALWGGGAVVRYAPDGTVADSIEVPAPHTTSMAFAGAELTTLVITTATDGLSESQRARHPLSGRLFVAHPGVAGVPSSRVAASVLDRGIPLGPR